MHRACAVGRIGPGRLPVGLDRHVPRFLAPVPPHAARLEQLLRVLDHGRIAAQHRVRIGRRQRNAGPRLESTIGDRLRDPSGERARMRLERSQDAIFKGEECTELVYATRRRDWDKRDA